MALTGLLKQTRGEKNTQQALCPCLARNARRKTTLLPCQNIMYWDPLFQNVGVLSKSYCKVRERKVSEVETATNFGWGLAQRSSDVSGISEYVQNWETIPDIIQRIFSPDKSHWKEKTVCICTCETSWETQCRRSVMQQVCWSKSGTNNRERLSSPPASCMRGIWRETTALVSAAQLAVKGLGVGGVAWKHPGISITHQKPALKYHYSCTSRFASAVTSDMMSGSESRSETGETDSLSVAAHNHRCVSEVRGTLNLWVWMK